MTSAPTRGLRAWLVALLAAALTVLFTATPAPHAHAASGTPGTSDVSTVAAALRRSPVYVDPAASDQLSASAARDLANRIEAADKPVFVAVLPAGFPTQNLFTDLRTATGITGLYGVRLGDRFDARADSSVLPRTAVRNLVGSVRGEDARAQLTDFTDRALANAGGHAPSSWGGGGSGGDASSTALITVGAVVVLAGAGAYALTRRKRRRRENEQRAALERLRVVVDEDITAFGEELDRLDFRPGEPGADDAMRADYGRALDAYEQAKSTMAGARRPEDVRGVTESLEGGRFSLARLAARREGRPLPERRPPCFFDPRHGPSVEDVEWVPAGGAPRRVPVCAADRARLADGREPMVREVETDWGRRPYWDAGPAYGPWAGGYFGGGLLPGLLVGTMLGGLMSGPGYGAYYGGGYGYGGAGYGDGGFGGGYEGGDVSGSDFDPGDFGGGFGGGGDFGGGGGGGDFGGGGGDF
ncbi:LPXTG-motif cell wall-anchored protein [Streptomyces sp. B3I7]|uniref:LPXTG cell wall anchor domain-containing protein n=1 Tax=Streptomyces sp. B3I7 TaxID=3042269 RepID=UPI002783E0A9|nr:LPXTG cell wall anchor domain-containing protein [Streptomyces sp. B3I7]MDQ0810973.1 LPXTG-motif cell wall-anchored protein [Streptomyces sp. B3I7]